jgi:CRP/FNR family transcriptional regulator, cyclic AMP receptor protein
MANSGISSALSKVPFFSGLDDKFLKVIAQTGKELSYKPGTMIVKQGEMGIGFYLVLDGQVEVSKAGKVLAKLSRGEFFGEMSLIDDQPRSADVVASAPTRCFALSSWAFSGLMKEHPEMAMPILKEVVKRLRTAQTSPTS